MRTLDLKRRSEKVTENIEHLQIIRNKTNQVCYQEYRKLENNQVMYLHFCAKWFPLWNSTIRETMLDVQGWNQYILWHLTPSQEATVMWYSFHHRGSCIGKHGIQRRREKKEKGERVLRYFQNDSRWKPWDENWAVGLDIKYFRLGRKIDCF